MFKSDIHKKTESMIKKKTKMKNKNKYQMFEFEEKYITKEEKFTSLHFSMKNSVVQQKTMIDQSECIKHLVLRFTFSLDDYSIAYNLLKNVISTGE